MSPRLSLRLTALVFLLFAAGHTVGFLTFRAPTAEGQAVFNAMNSVHFAADGTTYSYGNFYRGFGLFITVFQLFTAWLAWMLASWAASAPQQVRTIAWGLCVVQLISLGLSVAYFAAGPAVLSAIAVVLLIVAAVRLKPSIS
jgi:hypothetical protein